MARRPTLLVLLGVLGGLAGPEAAQAAKYAATVEDARDYRRNPARDIKRITSRFDSSTGRWTASVTFFGVVRASDNAFLRISLHDRDFGDCHDRGAPMAWFFVWTEPSSRTVGAYVGSRPDQGGGMSRRRTTRNGRVLKLLLEDPRIAGCEVSGIGNIRLSVRNRVFDENPGGADFRRLRQ